jgi:hypothetical protein
MTTPQIVPELEALTYEAPFLIEKLLKDHIVDTAEEGQALFAEVKKYIVLIRSDETTLWDMYSLRIDEVWHQFILFTHEYFKYCHRFFGGYIPHSPSNAPPSATLEGEKTPASFKNFQARYADLFGLPLPDTWYDERSITAHRRVLNHLVGRLTLQDANGMVDLMNERGEALLSVNELARAALTFITQTGAFYVRELPGDLTDEEKIALIATLVEYGVCRVGA